MRPPLHLTVDDAAQSRNPAIGDLVVGDSVEQQFAFLTEHRFAFSQVANDRAPVHEDERFAQKSGFEGTIIQGLCVSSRFSRLIGMYLPGEHAILESISLKYFLPTYENQSLTYRVEVVRVFRPMKVVRLKLSVLFGTNVHVSGEAQCLAR